MLTTVEHEEMFKASGVCFCFSGITSLREFMGRKYTGSEHSLMESSKNFSTLQNNNKF
jgi:hypothetical protein